MSTALGSILNAGAGKKRAEQDTRNADYDNKRSEEQMARSSEIYSGGAASQATDPTGKSKLVETREDRGGRDVR